MEEKIGKTEIENTFMFQKVWPKSTTILSTVEIRFTTGKVDTSSNIYRNEGKGGDHAEKRFLDELKSKIAQRQVTGLKAKLVQNYSPCRTCANDISEFMDKDCKDIEFYPEIEFANFYKDNPDNLGGLEMLKEKGVVFELLEGEEKWGAFLDDATFVSLNDVEKKELLDRAKSEARKINEVNALKIFNNHGLGNTSQPSDGEQQNH
ncbi:single-stranded DNA cytosine deaminase-like isoform X1 [Paramuricea clavata]|uniref:Single-stranded DNA cytosine deaminase-like isoform X1 n=1 Tax=Paramuricea clavata TaxID=317549 RepID=A0A6S7FS17_PARCT|nr:single-stranded DNA cytosine deaminase-like isoform X1 [Paramuricea clavata]